MAGTYYSGHLRYPLTFVVDEAGRLVLHAQTLPENVLEPWGPDEFLLPHEKFPGMPYYAWIRFHSDGEGQVTHLTVWHPRLIHHRFERHPQTRVSQTALEHAELDQSKRFGAMNNER